MNLQQYWRFITVQEERRCKTTWFQEHASHFLKRKVLKKNLKGWFIPRKTFKKCLYFQEKKWNMWTSEWCSSEHLRLSQEKMFKKKIKVQDLKVQKWMFKSSLQFCVVPENPPKNYFNKLRQVNKWQVQLPQWHISLYSTAGLELSEVLVGSSVSRHIHIQPIRLKWKEGSFNNHVYMVFKEAWDMGRGGIWSEWATSKGYCARSRQHTHARMRVHPTVFTYECL